MYLMYPTDCNKFLLSRFTTRAFKKAGKYVEGKHGEGKRGGVYERRQEKNRGLY